MALRLLEKFDRGSITVKVYRDTEWDEYVLRVYRDGIEQVAANYHTQYIEDAVDTAWAMINQGEMK
jgi:hypothetical protein